MKSWAIGLVMAWWFAQLHLELVSRWLLGRQASQWLALAASLVLGGLLQAAIDVKRRGHTLPLAPVLLLAGLAGCQLLWLLVFGQTVLFFSSALGWLQWATAVALMVGSGWVALRLAPVDEQPAGAARRGLGFSRSPSVFSTLT